MKNHWKQWQITAFFDGIKGAFYNPSGLTVPDTHDQAVLGIYKDHSRLLSDLEIISARFKISGNSSL